MNPTDGSDLGDASLDAALVHDYGAGYVDAATVALSFASINLGRAPSESPVVSAAPSVTPRQLRDTMGCLVTGVTVISTVSEGEDVAMTANSLTSVSLDPPLILVCIARSARFHDAIAGSDAWGVSILDAQATEISAHFATPGRSRREQMGHLAHHRGPVTGVALLDSSCATLECRTHAVHPGGDHSIVVGRVVAAEPLGDAVHPLVFHRGQYRWLRT